MNNITPSLEFENLEPADATIFEQKFASFARASTDQLHLVFDFDRTLTVKQVGSNIDVTTWRILRMQLPHDAQMRCEELFARYRPMELAGTLSQADAALWWSTILDIHVQSRINFSELEENFSRHVAIRPGTMEVFEFCAQNNIPIVIMSAGIREIIEFWCKQHHLRPALILATSMGIRDEIVSGWDPSSLIHARNKSEIDHPELNSIRSSRPMAMAIGDSLYDADMVSGYENALRIRILDPENGGHDQQAELKTSFEKFDAVITSQTFHPVHELLNKMRLSVNEHLI